MAKKTKAYRVVGQMFGYAKGSVFRGNEDDVVASGLLGSTLQEMPTAEAVDEAEAADGENTPVEGASGDGEGKPPAKPAAAPDKPATAPSAPAKAATVPGGPPMPGKAAVQPVPGK